MSRNNFTVKQQKDMRKRSKDICEAGNDGSEALYGMAPGERCQNKAKEFDHVTADALKRTKIKGIDEGLHVCKLHHDIKTNTNDKPKIAKAKRIDEAGAGISKPKQPIPSRKAVKVVKEFGTSNAAHRAAMEKLGKRIVPRRFT